MMILVVISIENRINYSSTPEFPDWEDVEKVAELDIHPHHFL
jgi:hypothetical protein